MTTSSPIDLQNGISTVRPVMLETSPPLVCLHCAATQATVLRDRQILDARAGYPTFREYQSARAPAPPAFRGGEAPESSHSARRTRTA